jgi:signal transduction histidine kinase
MSAEGNAPEEQGHYNFTVDSALLRELGERLVGRAPIGLAELIKNSYDADATKVVITFGEDSIEVLDNGLGMTPDEFNNFWMRIGTTHRSAQQVSSHFKRPLTGSKGVGRLAVQFLGSILELQTASKSKTTREFDARVNWNTAVDAGELTKARVTWKVRPRRTAFPEHARHGTRILIRGLKQLWEKDQFQELAREVWTLRPPFRASEADAGAAFDIELATSDPEQIAAFRKQLDALRTNWHARIRGNLRRPSNQHHRGTVNAQCAIQFAGEDRPKTFKYPIPNPRVARQRHECLLYSVDFEILVFRLAGRQSSGIKVQQAREYVDKFGGVQVYDSGFHLPYYGRAEADWLETEQDHALRRVSSELLPEKLKVPKGLRFLPERKRLLGGVQVNTSVERRHAVKPGDDFLSIQITRDRLVVNESYGQLRDVVRYALDLYAMEQARRSFTKIARTAPTVPLTETVRRVRASLEEFRPDIPPDVFTSLSTEITAAAQRAKSEEEEKQSYLALLGTLATAGIASVAYQHELRRQFGMLADAKTRIVALARKPGTDSAALMEVADDIQSWIDRASQTQAVFLPLLNEEDREQRVRLRVKSFFEQLVQQLKIFLRGVPVDLAQLDTDLRLPLGTFAEWSAVFQNVLVNAINAMIDSPQRQIAVRDRVSGRNREIIVMDTGVGVDLATAQALFEPFVRKLQISEERRRLALGGTGLGLTIVRMIAEQLNCSVSFVKPLTGFKTAFSLGWLEVK